MKLLSIVIEESASCGGLLNGFELYLRQAFDQETVAFQPICLIGPNGSGKSQLLQTLAEIFQCVWHACSPAEERKAVRTGLYFTVEYMVWPDVQASPVHVRISRRKIPPSPVMVETLTDGEWQDQDLRAGPTLKLLPTRIIGYTSGENETLSLPFLSVDPAMLRRSPRELYRPSVGGWQAMATTTRRRLSRG